MSYVPFNPTDSAHLGHRFRPYIKNLITAKEIAAARVQRMEPQATFRTEVYKELGSVDPTGYAQEPPEFKITVQEYVHDEPSLDLVVASKDPASDTTWNLIDYISKPDSQLQLNLLERDNADALIGEQQFDGCNISDVTWTWRAGQPIDGQYTFTGRKGRHYIPGHLPHNIWGAFDTTSVGGIRAKDARLYLTGTTTGFRVYRLSGMTIKTTWANTPIPELGNRALAGYTVDVPMTQIDLDFYASDPQPDDLVFSDDALSPAQYYDFINPNQIAQSAIRVFDPREVEGSTVLRAWRFDSLIYQQGSLTNAQVRGVATRRYSFLLPQVVVSGTGGMTLFKGDIA